MTCVKLHFLQKSSQPGIRVKKNKVEDRLVIVLVDTKTLFFGVICLLFTLYYRSITNMDKLLKKIESLDPEERKKMKQLLKEKK